MKRKILLLLPYCLTIPLGIQSILIGISRYNREVEFYKYSLSTGINYSSPSTIDIWSGIIYFILFNLLSVSVNLFQLGSEYDNNDDC